MALSPKSSSTVLPSTLAILTAVWASGLRRPSS